MRRFRVRAEIDKWRLRLHADGWRTVGADLITRGDYTRVLSQRDQVEDRLSRSVSRRAIEKAADDLVGAMPIDGSTSNVLVHDTFARLLHRPYLCELVAERRRAA